MYKRVKVDKRKLKKKIRRKQGGGNPPGITKAKILLFLCNSYPKPLDIEEDIHPYIKEEENIKHSTLTYKHVKELIKMGLLNKTKKGITIINENYFDYIKIEQYMLNHLDNINLIKFINSSYIEEYYDKFLKGDLYWLGWEKDEKIQELCKNNILSSVTAFRLFNRIKSLGVKRFREEFEVRDIKDLYKLFKYCFLIDLYTNSYTKEEAKIFHIKFNNLNNSFKNKGVINPNQE